MDLLELRRKALGQELVCFIESYEDDASCRVKNSRRGSERASADVADGKATGNAAPLPGFRV